MLIIANEDNIDAISAIFKKWDLEFKIIVMVTDNGKYTIKDRDRIIYEKTTRLLESKIIISEPDSEAAVKALFAISSGN